MGLQTAGDERRELLTAMSSVVTSEMINDVRRDFEASVSEWRDHKCPCVFPEWAWFKEKFPGRMGSDGTVDEFDVFKKRAVEMNRRLKTFTLGVASVRALLEHGRIVDCAFFATKCPLGLPDDATLQFVEFSNNLGCWMLTYEHESFDEVTGGQKIPFAEPEKLQLEVDRIDIVGTNGICLAEQSDEDLQRLKESLSAELYDRSIKTGMDEWQKEEPPIAFP